MRGYSPFDKPFTDISAEDLVALTDAAEGWYIEYKREVPKADAIAKSISAFANTYGGWLFYGVDEKSKAEPVAGSFPGIDRADVDPSLQRMRQAVATLLNPEAHFDARVLWGPCDAIGLPSDRGVLCIHVGWSPNTPHVHRNGHIYRRVADGSEPKAENDRFILDQLWKRGEKLSDEYDKWVKKPIKVSEKEEGMPLLRLLLTADLWGDKGPSCNLSLEQFRAIVRDTEGSVPATPYDTAHTSASGFVARQLAGNNPGNLGLTFKFWNDLTTEVLIPLPFYLAPPRQLSDILVGYKHKERFIGLLEKYNFDNARIIDLNLLLYVIIGAFRINNSLCAIAGWKEPLFAKVRMSGVWRTCPFLDVPHTLDCIEEHGLPMCLDDEVFVSPGTDPWSFIEIPPYLDTEGDARVYLEAFRLFVPIAEAFGIPGWHSKEGLGDETGFMADLLAAGNRAIEAQRMRNNKLRR